ncbi:hypothetical protein P4S64_14625 [Vibrio sp. M60_M31a]
MMRKIIPSSSVEELNTINQSFVGILKEDFAVMIVGVLDIVGVASSTLSNAKWVGLRMKCTLYWLSFSLSAVFSLSQYAAHLERRLK